MTNLDTLLERNRFFAKTDAKDKVPAIPFIPNMQAYVLTCIDPRVDPAGILGLELGDAIVARSIGGRVTDAVLADLAWVCHLHENMTPDSAWFELAVIHHTDCGSALFADDELRHSFAIRYGYDSVALRGLAVLDPAQTAQEDTDRLLAAPQLASQIAVSGYVYEIETGLLTQVTAPRLRADGSTTAS
ncbi:carbonic anhydrase [Actinoallomurus bryophytorum]|uniref:carbonic anhydrase n=1 Tax=Actinoallomurus bryophytorum TaxID=1490222 RepID=A0A543BZK5_9ACTN|nr:carbonic anhydrase [Actinoallomurus bryophytorum]TQL90263.1 carbonic anhydrase [Actinoallomurus bryophytorum]